MPIFTRPDAELSYEVHGSASPLLLFVFSVSRDFVRRCPTPLLVQPGTDKPHPAETSAEIARLAPTLEIQKDWRAPAHLAESISRVGEFLTRHTPAS